MSGKLTTSTDGWLSPAPLTAPPLGHANGQAVSAQAERRHTIGSQLVPETSWNQSQHMDCNVSAMLVCISHARYSL